MLTRHSSRKVAHSMEKL